MLAKARVARRRIGHRELGDLAGRRVEPPDRAVAVAGVPDHAVRVGGHRVRLRAGGQRGR
jgi:hypothetical protein